jgi:teichoic acid transport system ATP-binding protein
MLASEKHLLQVKNVGVKFSSYKREDLKNLTYNILLGRNENKQERWVLRGVSFTANKGDIIGIIGSNGAGKTTLCKVISGILRADEGIVESNGWATSFLSIGSGFNFELTGRENIYLNGMILGNTKSKMDELYDRIVEFSGLGDFILQPLKFYSSGMRARLGFSIAAFCEPGIIIIDEALSVGDSFFSQRASQKIQELSNKASIVIVVTHQLEFVLEYCTKALWLDRGKVAAWGPPNEIVTAYKKSVSQAPITSKRVLELVETKKKANSVEVISCRDLGIKYSINNTQKKSMFGHKRQHWALSNISFTIFEGEIVGVIGANGAGKSTLCRVLSGILKPDEGSISVHGETAALLSLGTGFNQELSGKDNIYLNGMLLGISQKEIKDLYYEIVEFSELSDVIERPIKQYSSGMKARLGFSIAAMIKPDIFIIDEALNTGDISFFEKASKKIQEIIDSARAVVVVTHSMNFVERVCTRAIWLDQGKLVKDGDPKSVIDAYFKK